MAGHTSIAFLASILITTSRRPIKSLQLHTLGEDIEDISYAEWLGGPANAYTLMIVCGVLCIALLRYFWNKYPSDIRAQKKAPPEWKEP